DRFDPARDGRPSSKPRTRAKLAEVAEGKDEETEETEETEEIARAQGARPSKRARRFALPDLRPRHPFLVLVVAELRLMVQGRNLWWYLVALGLLIAGAAAPLSAVRGGILPVAWLWPLALWSGMGAREKRFGTSELVFTGPRPVLYGGLALWLAGVLVAVVTTAGAALRFLAAGDTPSLLGWAAGSLFIPALAFALGSLSGSSRLFEITYLLLWYIGPMNHVPALDFMGVTPAALTTGMPWIYLLLAAALFTAGVAARARIR
ncbi:MAG TPA: hypothetical protein VMM92_08905, partial [Thermoanaerobaculia bacterium]|nr:hypothetical protein [Thermoanaerobaculia bacterium]